MRAPIALDASHSVWPIAASDGSSASAWSTFHPGGDAGITPCGAPLYLYGPYIREGFATAPSNQAFDRAFAIAIRTGGSETLNRCRDCAIGFRRSPKCLQQLTWCSDVRVGRARLRLAFQYAEMARRVRGRAYGRRPDDRPGEREALPDRIDGSSASPQNRPDERLRGRRLAPDRAPAEPGRGCRAGFPR